MQKDQEGKSPMEVRPVTSDESVGEYKALKDSLKLIRPVISYPACGTDISLSKVFPDSETYYIDTDEAAINALEKAGLNSNNHFINQSAYDYQATEPFDLVALRNASTDKHDVVGLTKGLRKGGYAVESHWGSTGGALQLLSDPNFKLIGVLMPDHNTDKFTLQRDDDGALSRNLANDTDIISKLAGRGYVFQKIN